ncbi:MAG TPA: CRISPR-associated endonuclease Cas1 [Saprospiraceae bacterium]|nr:CRISPR-associated endonuclease Cas1 [Saprospiraceae bacterium]HPN71439.1 CRISPR-associated endonuclease Cas1 [Saprospiraceae bacterium]
MEIHVNTFGTSLRMHDGLLSIKWQDQINQVPMVKIKSITVTKGIQLSTDVIYQCLENGIDVLLVERSGRQVGRLWNNRFGSISTIRKNQLDFAKSQQVVSWVIENMREKFANQKELIACFLELDEGDHTHLKQIIARIAAYSVRLDDYLTMPFDEASARIRAVEGQVSKMYFECINRYLPYRYQFTKRSKRPALDITNSMLNYCYGMLYSHLESALIKSGLDPFIGFFHRDEYNRPILTYDVIEPFRPWADWVVIHLCMNEILDESFFEVSDGGYWLRGDGKRLLIQHFVDYFEEIIDYQELHFTRFMQLEKRAQSLVQLIQNEETNDAR